MPFFQTFSLKFKKTRLESTTGVPGENIDFHLEDATHSGNRNMTMPSMFGVGTFVYSTAESVPNNANSQAFDSGSGHRQGQHAFVAPTRPERLGYRVAFWVDPSTGQQRMANPTETV